MSQPAPAFSSIGPALNADVFLRNRTASLNYRVFIREVSLGRSMDSVQKCDRDLLSSLARLGRLAEASLGEAPPTGNSTRIAQNDVPVNFID